MAGRRAAILRVCFRPRKRRKRDVAQPGRAPEAGSEVMAGGRAAILRVCFRPRKRRKRDVAQPGSAPEWGSGGRGFKSRRPDVATVGPPTSYVVWAVFAFSQLV